MQLRGGLGNQMFQYAAGRALAIKHNTQLVLDISDYENDPQRKYCLDCFKIKAGIASYSDIYKVNKSIAVSNLISKIVPFKNNIAKNFILKLSGIQVYQNRYYSFDPNAITPPLCFKNIISQRFFHFDHDFFFTPDNVYVSGTWISEKYFKHISSIIVEDFSFIPSKIINNDYENTILNSNSVSVHIRRGDKMNNPFYPSNEIRYFQNAIEYIKSHVENPIFFFFSDDKQWIRENIPQKENYIIIEGNLPDYEELRLMSLCRHNITTESTFSWWAAWLNKNEMKIVITPDPRRWINLPNFFVQDIIPDSWIIRELF